MFPLIRSNYHNKPVVVKFVPYDNNDRKQKREQSISLKVNHRNIIRTYGSYRTTNLPRFFGTNIEQVAFVMDMADCNLKEYLEEHYNMSYEQRKHLIVEITSGLVQLYTYKITLHDIKVFSVFFSFGCTI